MFVCIADRWQRGRRGDSRKPCGNLKKTFTHWLVSCYQALTPVHFLLPFFSEHTKHSYCSTYHHSIHGRELDDPSAGLLLEERPEEDEGDENGAHPQQLLGVRYLVRLQEKHVLWLEVRSHEKQILPHIVFDIHRFRSVSDPKTISRVKKAVKKNENARTTGAGNTHKILTTEIRVASTNGFPRGGTLIYHRLA